MSPPENQIIKKTGKPEQMLVTALDQIDQGILIYDENLTVLAFNKPVLDILDLPSEQFVTGTCFEDWIHYLEARDDTRENGDPTKRSAENTEKRLAIVRSMEPYQTSETRLDQKILEISGKPLAAGNFVTTFTEVTERINSERAVRASEKRLLEILGNSPIGVNILGLDGVMLFANTVFCKMTGWRKYELGFSQIRYSFADPDMRLKLFEETQTQGAVDEREVEFIRKDGSKYWAILSLRMIEYEGQEAVLAWLYEITERIEMEEALRRNQEFLETQLIEQRDREERLEAQAVELVSVAEELAVAEEKMKFLANHDALTGLPGLRLCRDRIKTAMALAQREKLHCALMFVDLDGFKTVNDTHGHEAGDAVLRGVADRIRFLTGEDDTVARIGGDEFVVVLSNIADPGDVAVMAGQMVKSLSTAFPLGTAAAATIGASIGIALYPTDGATSEDLMRSADNKMYEIKQGGKNNFGFVSPIETVGT